MLTFKKRIRKTIKRHTRAGDTLVEVALTIGILGFVVAAAIVTMNATLSASQSNLEKTMARNEIDIQAEAIRYIQNAYAAQRDLTQSDQEYSLLWKAMLAQAVTPSAIPELTDITSCSEFYTSGNSRNLYNSNAFIVNTHRLNAQDAKNSSLTNSIIIKSRTSTPSSSIFQPASVFPRILYSATDDTMSSESSSTLGNRIYRAEGIWVQVACGNNFSNCTSQGSGSKPDYYDFYIRTCWESANSFVPNTTGTIVRLYNPDLDYTLTNQQNQFRVNYYTSRSATPIYTDSAWDYTSHSFTIAGLPSETYRYNSDGWSFVGWCINHSSTNPQNTCSDPSIFYSAGKRIEAFANHNNGTINLVAVYAKNYSITFKSNITSGVSNFPSSPQTGTCRTIKTAYGASSCSVKVVPSVNPTHSSATFSYWLGDDGVTYNTSNAYHTFSGSNLQLTLTAYWNNRYRISYNSNGSGVSNMPSPNPSTSTNCSSTCSVTISSTQPTRSDGYVFLGWSSSSSATTANANYAPGKSITISSNLTLYAVWKQPYRITYNANGSNVYNVPSPSAGCTSSCTVQISSTLPTRSGYVFLGWSTSSSATMANSTYAPKKYVTISSNVTLYAVWQAATNDEWAIAASWSSGCSDIDSHTYIYQSGSQIGHIYYGNKSGTFNDTKVALDSDYTSPGYTETTTINNISSNTVYVCMHCFSGSTNFSSGGLKVVVTSSTHNFYNVYTTNSSSYAYDWAVVKIRGSAVYFKNSLSCNPGW